MRKKIILIIVVSTILFSSYYYWNNKHVILYPVNFENEYVIKTNQIPINFYKNMKIVLDNYNEDYILKNNKILIKYKKMNDLELIYNYTKKANDSVWLSQIKGNGTD